MLVVRTLSIQGNEVSVWENTDSIQIFDDILKSTFCLIRQFVLVAVIECGSSVIVKQTCNLLYYTLILHELHCRKKYAALNVL